MKETDILAVVSDKAYCVDHAIEKLFDGDEEAFERVDSGQDTTFTDKHGNKFDLVHDMSVSYAASSDDFYPNGLYCDVCGNELVAPQEEEDEEPTLSDLCEDVGISWDGVIRNEWVDMDKLKTMHGWEVTLTYQNRQMTTPYYTHQTSSDNPEVTDVMECLLSDANVENYDFEEWARYFGFNPDSRKAEKIYNLSKQLTEALKAMLGTDYDTFMKAERS